MSFFNTSSTLTSAIFTLPMVNVNDLRTVANCENGKRGVSTGAAPFDKWNGGGVGGCDKNFNRPKMRRDLDL